MSTTEKLRLWVHALDAELLEREQAVRLAVLAIASGHHLLVLGEPGTAKTMLAQRVAAMIEEKPFVTLLTKFSTPEDVFGPLSLKQLEAGVYERLVGSYLPAARVAFVDEIFKANASILNAMLSILNERVFFNGSTVLQVPLLAMLAASNELPDDDEGLEALEDRLVLRIRVEALRELRNVARLLQADRGSAKAALPPPITLPEISSLKAAAAKVRVGEEVMPALLQLREACRTAQLRVSDRRWRQAVEVMTTCAAIDGDEAVQAAHLGVLRFILWRRPDEQPKVVDALADALKVIPLTTVKASVKDLTTQLNERLAVQDSLLKRFENARQPWRPTEVPELKPEALEARHKADETIAAARELQEKLVQTLSGRSQLWRPFWEDVLPRVELEKKVDAVRNHRFWSDAVRDALFPAGAAT